RPGARRQKIEENAMAVPKRKTSPSRRGMRRSADALKKPTYIEDKDSGELRRPHHIDLKTGMYKGRQVLKARTEAWPGRGGWRVFLIGIPLLIIPFAIYNMIAFLTPGLGWTDRIATIAMMSGASWTITPEDALITLAILLLFLEIFKASRSSSSRGLVDHML